MTGCVLALDVGGTSMKGAVVDADLTLHQRRSFDTPADDGPAAVVAAIQDAVTQLGAAAASAGLDPVHAAGVGVPGLVDEERGVAIFAANLGWRDLPLAEMVTAAAGVPVALGHDIRTGAVAEAVAGAGREVANLLFVTLGTGIGGSAVVDGRVLTAGGYAAEIGHLRVADDTEPCGCGARGCLERVASASAIARGYASRSGRAVSGADQVADAVRAGDEAATAVWAQATDALARAFVTSSTLFGSELILLGGGLAEAGDLLLDPIAERVRQLMTFQRVPRIAVPAFGERAGCVGAGVLAWRRVEETGASPWIDVGGSTVGGSTVGGGTT